MFLRHFPQLGFKFFLGDVAFSCFAVVQISLPHPHFHQDTLCRVHTARFSNSSDRHCFHTAGLSGVGFSHCCFHIAPWIRDRWFHIARFHNRKNHRQLRLILKYSQTHARSDKEITQGHSDIMVYKSSPNTQ